MQDYKKILKSNSKKRTSLEAILNCGWDEIFAGLFLLLWYIANYIVCGCFIYSEQKSAMEFIMLTAFTSIFSSIITFITVCGILIFAYGIFALFYAEIPLRLNRRYLPLTMEEMKNLPFKTDEEVYDFALCICSKKVFKNRIFVKGMRDDVAEFLELYCDTFEKSFDDLWKEMPEELQEYLKEIF